MRLTKMEKLMEYHYSIGPRVLLPADFILLLVYGVVTCLDGNVWDH